MSASKHYDVAVLGMGLGALASAALLARRGWRVVVIGHGHRRATYALDDVSFSRRPFTFLGASSPTWGRVLVELAQSQTFRRRLTPVDPMFQLCMPGVRVELPPDTVLFQREIDREFPASRRVLDDLYGELAKTNAVADEVFEHDAVWPPGGFWERRETEKLSAALPWAGDPDLLAELPLDHAFRAAVDLSVRFAADQVDPLPTFSRARLHGAWTRGVQALEGGEEELTDFLVERLRAHGGELLASDRVERLAVKGGKVRGVYLSGEEEPIGVTFVVLDGAMEDVLEIAPDVARKLEEQETRVEPAEGRFVVSLVVRTEGVPASLGAESFVVPSEGLPMRLQRARVGDGVERLTAEALLPLGSPLDRQRSRMCTSLFEVLPFVERHVVACDSPHDGLPVWDARDPGPSAVEVTPGLRARRRDRTAVRPSGGSLDAEPMIPRYAVRAPTLRGLGAEPLRAGIGNVFLAGRGALPSLGQEGQLLAAWGVARIITRTDRRKEKMLRDMWSKVELS
ncbi:MAG: phytoene dehydrogenase [Myxococcales bacterium]|nr:phytoene dehydrogenase [Myxococcales bacterium]